MYLMYCKYRSKSRNELIPERQDRDRRTFNAKMKPRKYKLLEGFTE